MKERQIEAAYRARFNERRSATEGLDRLYDEQALVAKIESRAWLIAAARPRIARTERARWTGQQLWGMFEDSKKWSECHLRSASLRPLDMVNIHNLRPGRRRVIADKYKDHEGWKAARVGIHFDGSVTLSCALGGWKTGLGEYFPDEGFSSVSVESAVIDFMALAVAMNSHFSIGDYEVRIGIECNGAEPMVMFAPENLSYGEAGIPMMQFSPVETTVRAGGGESDFHEIRELVKDCVSQGGIGGLHVTKQCECEECSSGSV